MKTFPIMPANVNATPDDAELPVVKTLLIDPISKSRSKWLIASFCIWLAASVGFFIGEASGLPVPPIANDALGSLVGFYLPVFLLAVLLLLYLTRLRPSVDWEQVYGVNKAAACSESTWALAYLLVTQLGLFFAVGIGLHFPGPAEFEYANATANGTGTASHDQADVWAWAGANTLFYVAAPVAWLCLGTSFSAFKLLSSLKWRRDLWILLVYWAIDFFGPIIFEADDDFLGLSAMQYCLGIPLGLVLNTFGAGLPVVVMMHIVFLPRVAVLCPVDTWVLTNKMTTIALGGIFYAVFSLFDQGVGYGSAGESFMSVTYIVMTQTLVGMGKATFTVVTGNPFIHFVTLHVVSARVPMDTKMYSTIFGVD